MSEAELPLNKYHSFQELFTRRLKSNLRPQSISIPGFINSPVDGEIVACGRIRAGQAIQAKGLPYQVKELLKYDTNPDRFEEGHYVTLYLSPKDYHHIHVPLSGKIETISLVEGELWPVNRASTANILRLYERNRRAVLTAAGIDLDEGLEVAIVLIGAIHVGEIVIDSRWLNGQKLMPNSLLIAGDNVCQPGNDLGVFQFGSTVVLLIGGSKSAQWHPDRTEGSICVGQRLGSFKP